MANIIHDERRDDENDTHDGELSLVFVFSDGLRGRRTVLRP
jgi:hypothetical protein